MSKEDKVSLPEEGKTGEVDKEIVTVKNEHETPKQCIWDGIIKRVN